MRQTEKIHLVGLDQAGMVGLARLFGKRGHKLTASVSRRTPAVRGLEEELQIEVGLGFEQDRVDEHHSVVVGDNVGDDNPELHAAARLGRPRWSRQQALAALIGDRQVVAVAGSHGAGSVAAMVAWIMERAGMAPGYYGTAKAKNFGVEARWGDEGWFVVELGGDNPNLSAIPCDYGVISFLERSGGPAGDSAPELAEAIGAYLESRHRLKEVFVNLDCLGVRRLVGELKLRPTGYAFEHRTEYQGLRNESKDFGQQTFEARHRDKSLGHFSVAMAGKYHAVNGLAAIAVTRRLGVDIDTIKIALSSFSGLENRFVVAGGGGVLIAKDRVTRPAGIERLLAEIGSCRTGRLVAVIESPRYAKIEGIVDDYRRVLEGCDEVIIGSAEGAEDDGERLVYALGEGAVNATVLALMGDAVGQLVKSLKRGDCVAFFGNNEFLELADQVRAELASQAERAPTDAEQPRLEGPLADSTGPNYE